MAQVLHAQPEPAAQVEGDTLILRNFQETDPDVVSVAREAEDPDATVHRVLQIGAKAIRGAEASVETEVVEKAFEEMTTTFDAKVAGAVEEIQDVSRELLDEEEGELHLALEQWKQDVEEVFDGVFDEDSKRSVLSKLDRVLEKAGEMQIIALRRLIDPDNDESPISRWRKEIVKTVETRTAEINKAVQALSERIAVRDAEAKATELTAVKGFSFEDAIHAIAGKMAASHGDVAEKTGTVPGALGTKHGDEVIHVNPEDTLEEIARFAFEMKDRKMGLKSILDELDQVAENREALATVAVFSRQANAPTSIPFQCYGTKAIVVIDKDEFDERALELAYMWARWVVRRQVSAGGTEIDFDRVDECLSTAQLALKRASSIRRAHTSAKKSIDQAGSELNHLEHDVDVALERMREELSRGTETE